MNTGIVQFRATVWGGGLATVLALLMLTEWARTTDNLPSALKRLREEFVTLSLSKSDQGFMVTALALNFLACAWFQHKHVRDSRRSPHRSQDRFAAVPRTGLFSWAVGAYAWAWTASPESGSPTNLVLGIDQTTNIHVLLVGLLLSCGATALITHSNAFATRFRSVVLVAVTAFLAATSMMRADPPHVYRYHEAARWTGLWVNPNTYGLLMGVGLVLGVGLLIAVSQDVRRGGEELGQRQGIKLFLLALAVLLCGCGLVQSYSRGAWLATVCGLAFVLWPLTPRWIQNNRVPLALLLVSVCTLVFWQCRFSEHRLARRIFSAANINDFSWRNRVTVWQGSARMVLHRPLLGFGWGRVETAFAESYRAERLEDVRAVQLNDFFTLATSAGIPALLFFLACTWISTWGNPATPPPGRRVSGPWQRTCRATVIAMLIAFWFDGGLFKLAVGPLFWVLLELSRVRQPRIYLAANRNEQSPPGCRKNALRWTAGVLTFGAASWTAAHFMVPRLTVSPRSLAFAQSQLLPAAANQDLEWLAPNPVWHGRQLLRLLEHVELANYNRQLVEWKLDDSVYREFVLSPEIDPRRDGLMNWRRPLWEYFYPRIRRQNSTKSAVEVVTRELHARVAVLSDALTPTPIAEIWKLRSTDDPGFQALCVAALRSVGIPARLGPADEVEYWSETQWKTVVLHRQQPR